MNAAELLAELESLGIRVEADGDRLRYHPRSAATSDVLDRLKTHKAALLAVLRPSPAENLALPADATEATVMPTSAVCRCGSTKWRDVPIHGGQTIRRDCARCGRFIDFPIWHGNDTGQ
jgi:hypothetical protein